MFHSHQPYLSRFFLFLPFLILPFLILVFGICSLATVGHAQEAREKNVPFSGLTLPPASGNKPDSIVVLFHGYGDIGENFLFLSASWAESLPNTLFVAPDGPIARKGNASGKQWLRTPSKNRPQLLKEIKGLTLSLNRYLDNLLKTYGLPPEKLALVGFSQGARVALHVGLRRPVCAGVVAFSGAFLDDPAELHLSRPPILLIHGVEDPNVSSSLAQERYKRLEALKMPVTLFLMPGVGHDIDPRGSAIAGEFLKDCFSGKIKGSEVPPNTLP